MLDGSTQVVEAGQIECTESDWRTIDRKLKRIAKRRRALDHEETGWLLKAERARVHTRFGYGSFFEYLERVLGYTPKTAVDRLRVAHTLEEHPALGKAGLSFTARSRSPVQGRSRASRSSVTRPRRRRRPSTMTSRST